MATPRQSGRRAREQWRPMQQRPRCAPGNAAVGAEELRGERWRSVGCVKQRGVGPHGWPRRAFNQTPESYRGGGSGSGRSRSPNLRLPPRSAPPSPAGEPAHTACGYFSPTWPPAPPPPPLSQHPNRHQRRANRRRRQRLPLSPPARLRRRSGSPPARQFSRMRVPATNSPPRSCPPPPRLTPSPRPPPHAFPKTRLRQSTPKGV